MYYAATSHQGSMKVFRQQRDLACLVTALGYQMADLKSLAPAHLSTEERSTTCRTLRPARGGAGCAAGAIPVEP
jgi:hypothetical protein